MWSSVSPLITLPRDGFLPQYWHVRLSLIMIFRRFNGTRENLLALRPTFLAIRTAGKKNSAETEFTVTSG